MVSAHEPSWCLEVVHIDGLVFLVRSAGFRASVMRVTG